MLSVLKPWFELLVILLMLDSLKSMCISSSDKLAIDDYEDDIIPNKCIYITIKFWLCQSVSCSVIESVILLLI